MQQQCPPSSDTAFPSSSSSSSFLSQTNNVNSLLSVLDAILDQINIRDMNLNTSLDQICLAVWRPAKKTIIKIIAILAGYSAETAFQSILGWSARINEIYSTRRKFSSAINGGKSDKNAIASIVKTKRVCVIKIETIPMLAHMHLLIFIILMFL